VPGLSLTRRAVLSAIAYHARKDTWLAWPSLKTIAEMSGVCLNTARTAVRDLVDMELVEVVHAGRWKGDPTVYALPPAKGATGAPFEKTKGCNSRSQRVQLTSPKGATGAPELVFNQFNRDGRPATLTGRPPDANSTTSGEAPAKREKQRAADLAKARQCGRCDNGWLEREDGSVERCDCQTGGKP
jgi:hypothetical protein